MNNTLDIFAQPNFGREVIYICTLPHGWADAELDRRKQQTPTWHWFSMPTRHYGPKKTKNSASIGEDEGHLEETRGRPRNPDRPRTTEQAVEEVPRKGDVQPPDLSGPAEQPERAGEIAGAGVPAPTYTADWRAHPGSEPDFPAAK